MAETRMYRQSLDQPQCLSPYRGRAQQVWPPIQELSQILQALTLVLFVWLPLCTASHAEPTTWFEPTQSVTGNAGSQFGSAVACSDTVTSIGHSYIAVGAPQEGGGVGRVHIVGPAGVVQTLAPPTIQDFGHFGYAVAFAKDINGDSVPELLVGEPDDAAVGGELWRRVSHFPQHRHSLEPLHFVRNGIEHL